MSCQKPHKNLSLALAQAYPGPKKAERIAADMGVHVNTARNALRGEYPQAWLRFLRLIQKSPRILADAMQTTWAEELALRSELEATRRHLIEIERRINAQAAPAVGEVSQLAGPTGRPVK